MPSYDYHCPANGRTIEVRHGMNERMTTWGEVCARAEIDPGKTRADSPVERLMGTGVVRTSEAATSALPMAPRGCGPGCGCHPG
ncbi:MAG: hypothetical protein KF817_08230 [Phycisphaeraceae bacterium]|nr:hypothetical protein [Phycisphaeraceae bacterium]